MGEPKRQSERLPRSAWWVVASLVAASSPAACSNDSAACSAPATGTFTATLHYAETATVSLACDGGGADASTCVARPHPFDGATWKVVVSGSTATVTSAGATWSCQSLAPRSAPGTTNDGGPLPGTGCYLELRCGTQATGDAGAQEIELQILAKSATDVLVVAHDPGADCCTDEYTGAWR